MKRKRPKRRGDGLRRLAGPLVADGLLTAADIEGFAGRVDRAQSKSEAAKAINDYLNHAAGRMERVLRRAAMIAESN